MFETKNSRLTKTAEGIAQFFKESLYRMKSEGADLITLTLGEMSEEEKKQKEEGTTGWINMDSTRYYDFQTLTPDEQKLIKDKKSYQRISLVRENVWGIRTYSTHGIEVFDRIHIIPLLPVMKDESPLNYVSKGNFYNETDFEYIGRVLAEANVSEKELRVEFEKGIVQYHIKTHESMKQAGVYQKLESMETRPEIHNENIEGILAGVRKNIRDASLAERK